MNNHILQHNQLQKARIYNSFNTESASDIEKAEGARGGKVIGHTKSGKPIYDSANHASHSNFTPKDHNDAAEYHEAVAERSVKHFGKETTHSKEHKVEADIHHAFGNKLSEENRKKWHEAQQQDVAKVHGERIKEGKAKKTGKGGDNPGTDKDHPDHDEK